MMMGFWSVYSDFGLFASTSIEVSNKPTENHSLDATPMDPPFFRLAILAKSLNPNLITDRIGILQ